MTDELDKRLKENDEQGFISGVWRAFVELTENSPVEDVMDEDEVIEMIARIWGVDEEKIKSVIDKKRSEDAK